MQCLVVYDIPDDKARTRIADVCLDYGLDRIQFSAFLGNLARTHQEELLGKIGKALGRKRGNVQLFAICEKDWALRLVIDQKGKAERDSTEVDDAALARQAASPSSDRRPSRSQEGESEQEASAIPPPAAQPKEEDLPPFF